MYEVEPEVLGSLTLLGSPVANQLDYSAEYRRELARAHSELYLVQDNAIVYSLLHHRPLREYLDPDKVRRARRASPNQDPIQNELNPILLQLGKPLM
jgi:hypothetical protein